MADESSASSIAALLESYRATRYCIDAPAPFQLEVDRCSEPLRLLLQATRHRCAALLTAFNPASSMCTAQANTLAQQALLGTLESGGWVHLPGRNEDPRGQWPTEISALALGLPLTEARRIAAQYGQLAFLWADATACPRLIETAA